MTASELTGAWLGSEYVYDPSGAFLGVMRQHCRQEPLEDGKIRVTQHREAGPELAGHPIAAFGGEHVFTLSVEGRARRCHGPDVLGADLAWGNGALTGRGLWPLLGHNFTYFAVSASPERLITGAKFFNVSQLIASVIGLIVPERPDQPEYPPFTGLTWPGDLRRLWSGTLRIVSADGVAQSEVPLRRRYRGRGWEDLATPALGEFYLKLDPVGDRLLASGAVVGVARQFGWLLEVEAVTSYVPGTTVGIVEVLDGAGENLIGLRHWRQDNVLQRVEILKLKPEKG
jgi:hypothetical protein